MINFILTGGIFILGLILLLLIKSNKQQLSQRLLILFFGSVLFLLTTFVAELHHIEWLYQLSFLLSNSIGYLLGPLVLFYIASLFGQTQLIPGKVIWHFSPFLIHLLVASLPIAIQGFDINPAFSYIHFIDQYAAQFNLIETLYLLTYVVFAIRLFNRYQQLLKSRNSYLEQQNLDWSKRMLFCLFGLLSLDILLIIYEIIKGDLSWNTDILSLVSAVIISAYLAYYGLHRSGVLLPPDLIDQLSEITDSSKDHPPSKKPLDHLSEEAINDLKIKLQKVLKEEQPFLRDTLSLGELARMIPTTDKTLSALINQYLNTNFYDLINAHRVESVKEKMQCPDFKHYTLFGIAQQSGFKSKTSFYRIFKKQTGQSPSSYRHQL